MHPLHSNREFALAEPFHLETRDNSETNSQPHASYLGAWKGSEVMTAIKAPQNPELDEIRKQLLALLNGGQAHADFETAIEDFSADLRGKVPEGLPYSAWQL